jgi:DNA-binding PadR family transcriptional regulator
VVFGIADIRLERRLPLNGRVGIATRKTCQRSVEQLRLAFCFGAHFAILRIAFRRSACRKLTARQKIKLQIAHAKREGAFLLRESNILGGEDQGLRARAVQRLEDAGYIERHEDTDDRRSKVLQLTAAGRAVYQKIWPLVVAREEYILSALEPGERSALARVMEKVQRRTEELIQRG